MTKSGHTHTHTHTHTHIYIYIYTLGGACGVMVIVVGDGHDAPISKPEQSCLYFTLR